MVSIPTDKLKAAETALTQIERQFGKGSIMRLGSKEFSAISSISTGSIGVDAALGVGGVPRGRIVEIFGPESSGKTTLSLHIIAEARTRRRICQEARRRHRQPPRLAARQRRAGAGDRRGARPLRRHRHHRHRLRRRARSPRGAGRRDGRDADGTAGPPDVSGPAQINRHCFEI